MKGVYEGNRRVGGRNGHEEGQARLQLQPPRYLAKSPHYTLKVKNTHFIGKRGYVPWSSPVLRRPCSPASCLGIEVLPDRHLLSGCREQSPRRFKESKPVYISISCKLPEIRHPTFAREPVPFCILHGLSKLQHGTKGWFTLHKPKKVCWWSKGMHARNVVIS
ncbi:hypothetical protein H6P81_014451 [Aristolochia fimbriata]|uniref:Uncharacterized protein n=1 Tax=Aristolochia fimbriata TaxID=158543 RepID=A0AAV7EM54_ARIFI|nr:hypothetical protein H6P81_014451 [Aristolochia fimbriata]